MGGFIARRLLVAIPVVLVATFVVFLLVSARGDPLQDLRLTPGASEATVENLEREYHLDEPLLERYGSWLADFVRGDWGTSFATERPVGDMVRTAAWNSFLLAGTAVAFSVVLAVVLGVVSAARERTAFDYTATGFAYFGFSMPDFFFALLLQLVLVVWLREQFDVQIFYVQGKYSVGEEGNLVNLLQHMALPVATLMLTSVAAWSRYQRDSMLDVLRSDYVRTARAMGVPRARRSSGATRSATRSSRSSPSSRSTPACSSVVWWWSSGSSSGPASGCCSSRRWSARTTPCSSPGPRSRPRSSWCATWSPT